MSDAAAEACANSGLVSFRYVNRDRTVATTYPANPGGSPFGITSVTNADGRVTIMMPHPERSTRSVQNSWRPDGAGEEPRQVSDPDATAEGEHLTERLDVAHLLVGPRYLHTERVGHLVLDHQAYGDQ